jgi:CBS domain-containing protein
VSILDALKIFKQARVRRLPVVDGDDKLQGILSISDIVLNAAEGRDKTTTGISSDDVVNTLKAICAPHAKATAVGA